MNRSTFWRALAPLVALALHGAAHAGAGTLVTTVTTLQDNVTYSDPTAKRPLDTYIGYTFTIANAGGNTINNIRFTGTTSTTRAGEAAVFASVENGSCTTANGGTTITCTVGQLKAGESTPTIAVFFKAPARAGAACTAPCNDDAVAFSGQVLYAEGTGGITSPPDNSIDNWAATPVALGTDNPSFVKSAVQKAGGTLFTGNGGLTFGPDKFSTTVAIPAAPTYTTAQILESTLAPESGACGNALPTCYTTALTIPGSFTTSPYLQITLRVDAAAVPSGTKINAILLSYTADGSSTPVDVGLCANATTPSGTGIPCIASRKIYPKNSKNGKDFPVELEGDYEWQLLNTHNGSIKVF